MSARKEVGEKVGVWREDPRAELEKVGFVRQANDLHPYPQMRAVHTVRLGEDRRRAVDGRSRALC